MCGHSARLPNATGPYPNDGFTAFVGWLLLVNANVPRFTLVFGYADYFVACALASAFQ